MGRPLGPTMTNDFMCFHEENWLEQYPTEFASVMHKRYIDDTFILFRLQSNAAKFLKYLN